mmetsp:Transcript_22806/g.20278  ORF Transcript_22806/g.20278 Transcript_22806/m.20278 type:complete len:144 (-) Transcript_22806:72-503(-)
MLLRKKSGLIKKPNNDEINIQNRQERAKSINHKRVGKLTRRKKGRKGRNNRRKIANTKLKSRFENLMKREYKSQKKDITSEEDSIDKVMLDERNFEIKDIIRRNKNLIQNIGEFDNNFLMTPKDSNSQRTLLKQINKQISENN